MLKNLVQKVSIQMGSKIRTCLDFERSKLGWILNGQNFEWDLKYESPTI